MSIEGDTPAEEGTPAHVTRFDGVRVPATDYGHPVWLDNLAGEGELLGVIERADAGHDGPDGPGALRGAVHRRALYGDVVGQVVQPDRMAVVGGRDAGAVEAGDVGRRACLGGRVALDGHEQFLS